MAFSRKDVTHGRGVLPAAYTMIYWIVQDICTEKGYCAALHGSMSRDLDIVCVPWTEEACGPNKLIKKIEKEVGLIRDVHIENPEKKPHGRLAWKLHCRFGYLDISIIPRKPSSIDSKNK